MVEQVGIRNWSNEQALSPYNGNGKSRFLSDFFLLRFLIT